MRLVIDLAEKGILPEPLLRLGVRRLLKKRLRGEARRYRDYPAARDHWVQHMRHSTIALHPGRANAQHYEVPAWFFRQVLGPHMKYSCSYWKEGTESLREAEEAMLELSAHRADLRDGQRILELGCGWGSLTLWTARRYPGSQILAVSNSHSQRKWIEAQAREQGLRNVRVLTADMNIFQIEGRFDRVVSVEMFEHMRDWESLLKKIRGWLDPRGSVFLHFFAHRIFAYPFGTESEEDWMGRHFFTGGMMPSAGLVDWIDCPFEVVEASEVSGTHYARTAQAWLDNLHRERDTVVGRLKEEMDPGEAIRLYHRWRLFFLSCIELFGFDDGTQWGVRHLRLEPLPAGVDK